MKQQLNLGNSQIDGILPIFGQPRVKTPIWDESQKMFITDQYTSASGNTYYLGVRVCERFVTILHIGLYHNWTYINDVEVYCFNGTEKVLIGKTSLDVYYDEDLVRATTEKLLRNYIESQFQLQRKPFDSELIAQQAHELTEQSYRSMLTDSNTVKMLDNVVKYLIPQNCN